MRHIQAWIEPILITIIVVVLVVGAVFGVSQYNAKQISKQAFRADCLEANHKYEYTDSYDLLCRSKTGEITKVWRYEH